MLPAFYFAICGMIVIFAGKKRNMGADKNTDILIAHGIRPTANRILVVRALLAADRPMSLTELEHKILTLDKSGIFRALTIFRDNHLVHVIEDGGGSARYELCTSDGEADDDLHVHFYCESCHRTFCIDNVPVPADAAAFTLLKEQLVEVLSTLTPREEKVLKLRFGIEDGRTRTLEEVGKEFNVTRERIRQIEAKALRKLRHPSRSKRLKDFLD